MHLKYCVFQAPQWLFLERPVGGGNAEEEVIEEEESPSAEGSVGLPIRKRNISRSWFYIYLSRLK